MRSRRDPFKSFLTIGLSAPLLFGIGTVLFRADRFLGERIRVEGEGFYGVAANMSVTGMTAVVRLFFSYGPYLLILLGLALPVAGAMYTLDRLDSRRGFITSRRRRALLGVAWAETLCLLGLFLTMPK